MQKVLSTHFFYILAAVIVSLPVIAPYFHSGYFPTHDGEWAVVRLSEMYRLVIQDHQIPARYSEFLNFGHGYPLFNFAYPFPYYFGLLFLLAGLGFITSIKVIFALTVIGSIVTMYLAAHEIWKDKIASFASSLLYVYLPYRMVDLYVRGSIGESIALVLFPLLLYFVSKISRTKRPVFSIVGFSVTLAVLITAHNIMTILFAPVLGIYILYYIVFFTKTIWWRYVVGFVGGVGLSAFFWMPAIFEKRNILLSVVPIADRNLYYVNFPQLVIPYWSYGTPNASDAFSYQLGIPQIIVFCIAAVILAMLLVNKKLLQDKVSLLAATTILLIVGLLFLLFKPSAFLWEHIPLLSEINYPWTLLAPIGFLLALLGGYLVTQHKYLKYVALFVVFVAVVMHLPYAHPSNYNDKTDDFYITNDATTTSSTELLPLWVHDRPSHRADQKIQLVVGQGKVSKESFQSTYNSQHILISPPPTYDQIIRINTIYYPGWEAYIDGKKTDIDYSNDQGVMDIKIPKGTKRVELFMTETPIRFTADTLTLLSGLGLLGYLLYTTLLTKKTS